MKQPNRGGKRMLPAALLCSVLLAGGGLAAAQAGDDYVMQRSVMGSGGPPLGANIGGDAIQLQWTLGQPFVDVATGGDYVLVAGFWTGATPTATPTPDPAEGVIFMPHVAR